MSLPCDRSTSAKPAFATRKGIQNYTTVLMKADDKLSMNLQQILDQKRVFPIEWNFDADGRFSTYVHTIGTNGATGNVFLLFQSCGKSDYRLPPLLRLIWG